MKKRQNTSQDAAALRSTMSAVLISISIILLASSFKAAPAADELGAAVAPSPEGSGSGSWTFTGGLNIAREGHTATLLPNGKVLVAGGHNNSPIFSSAELYDPANGIWTPTGSLNFVRYGHTATLLPNGKVLVAGGYDGSALSSAELYDPTSEVWTITGSLHIARQYHTATLLPSGKVLVAGGGDLSAELYDPVTGSWSTTGSLGTPRQEHTATLLLSGKVLVAGGFNGSSGSLSSAEVYDPASGNWSSTGSLGTGRYGPTATLLPTGKVLVAGGVLINGMLTHSLSSAEVYDPTSGSWSSTGSLNFGRYGHTATLLPNGKVLVAAGVDLGIGHSGYLSSAEVYDPASGSWTFTGSLNVQRASQSGTLLPNGKVLVAGGANPVVLSSAELYDSDAGVCTVCHKRTQTLVLPCNSMEYRRHLDHGDSIGACPSGAGRND